MELLEQIQQTIAQSPELEGIHERLGILKEGLLELEGQLQDLNHSQILTADDRVLLTKFMKKARALYQERTTLGRQIQKLADQNAPEVLYFEQLLEALPAHIRVTSELRKFEVRLITLRDNEPDELPC